MKRLLILLAALGLMVAFAVPAGAARPGPTLVNVTFTDSYNFDMGSLDTTKCGGPLVMEMDTKGNLFTGQDGPSIPRIWIDAAIPWVRFLPEYDEGDFFDECHGGPVGGSPVEWAGGLWITPADDSIEILWLFDHYWDRVPKNPNKPDGPTMNLIENFVLRGEAFDPDGDGIYGGDFTIGLHGEEQPFGSDYLEFTFTMTQYVP